jgi:hypothetical protein
LLVQSVIAKIRSFILSGKKGRISWNPFCLLRMGRISFFITFTNSSFFSIFTSKSRMRAIMMVLLSSVSYEWVSGGSRPRRFQIAECRELRPSEL